DHAHRLQANALVVRGIAGGPASSGDWRCAEAAQGGPGENARGRRGASGNDDQCASRSEQGFAGKDHENRFEDVLQREFGSDQGRDGAVARGVATDDGERTNVSRRKKITLILDKTEMASFLIAVGILPIIVIAVTGLMAF